MLDTRSLHSPNQAYRVSDGIRQLLKGIDSDLHSQLEKLGR